MESKSSSGAVIVAILILSCGILRVEAAAEVGRERKIKALFLFGDSLVDVGNNNYLPMSLARANFPHNGVDFPYSKPTGRFTNGLNFADFIARKLGVGKLSPPPYLSIQGIHSIRNFIGANFASGASGILNQTGATSIQRIPLSEQVYDFMKIRARLVSKLGEQKTKELVLNKSMFVFVTGSNDLFSYKRVVANKTTTPHEFTNLLTSSFKIELQKLYDAGARKIFVVGAGPVGCCPSQRLNSKNGTCDKAENKLAKSYNKKLYSLLSKMSKAIPDFKFAFGDTYHIVSHYIKSPRRYGFREGRQACCGGGRLNAEIPCLPLAQYCNNRKEYVFWDFYHPTDMVARKLVHRFYHGSSTASVRPVNMAHLVASSSS